MTITNEFNFLRQSDPNNNAQIFGSFIDKLEEQELLAEQGGYEFSNVAEKTTGR